MWIFKINPPYNSEKHTWTWIYTYNLPKDTKCISRYTEKTRNSLLLPQLFMNIYTYINTYIYYSLFLIYNTFIIVYIILLNNVHYIHMYIIHIFNLLYFIHVSYILILLFLDIMLIKYFKPHPSKFWQSRNQLVKNCAVIASLAEGKLVFSNNSITRLLFEYKAATT